jgi:REP-associated tyrosine transposase
MPRRARLVVPNFPHHLLQRGSRREPVFLGESDYAHYLDNLWSLSRELDCQVHAYCLMPNHVHLLVNPGQNPANLGRLMKSLAGRHACYMNRSDGRNGALWEGRFRSSPVAREYVLACCRYIELNPVRTYLARDPENCIWSSYPARFEPDGHCLVADPAFLALSADPAERLNRYAYYVQSPTSFEELSLIRAAIHTSR